MVDNVNGPPKIGRPRKQHPLPKLKPLPRLLNPDITPTPPTGQPYGKELILDIHKADPTKFTRPNITRFMNALCDLIGMVREDLHFWDYEDCPGLKANEPPHLQGTSAVQFIRTSNITIHTLDTLERVYVNIFSCKTFDAAAAGVFTADWFGGVIVQSTVAVRV
jgi:S-adenosylmethionine/arginine decarboxylase-like enzyme